MKFDYARVKRNDMVCCTIGVVCAILVGLLLLFLSPIFIINEYIDQSLLPLVAAGVHLFATFVASTVCAIRRGGGFRSAIIGVSIWFALSIFSGVLIFESPFERIWLMVVACFLGCLFGMFIGYWVKKPHNNSKKWKIR